MVIQRISTESAPKALGPYSQGIRAVDQASDPSGYALSIAPETFEQQMAWLHEQGYARSTISRILRDPPGGGSPMR